MPPEEQKKWQDNSIDVPYDGSEYPIEEDGAEIDPGMLASGAGGIAQGVTLDHADEIVAGLKNPRGGAKQFISSYLGKKYPLDDKDIVAYKEERDALRGKFDTVKKAHPYVYGGSQALGAALPAAGLALTGAEAIPIAAALGGTAGLGSSKAEDPGNLALDASLPTVIAPVIQGGLNIAGKGLKSGADRFGQLLKRKGAQLTENATGASPSQAGEFKGYGGGKTDPETGRYLLDNKLVPWSGNQKIMRNRVTGALDDAGNRIGQQIQKLDDAGNVIDTPGLWALAKLKEQEMLASGADKATIDEFRRAVNRELTDPGYLASTINKMKGFWQDLGKYSNKAGNRRQNVSEKGFADVLNQAENQNASRAADVTIAPKLAEAKNDYSFLKPVSKAMDSAVQKRKQGKLNLNLRDTLAGTLLGAAGGYSSQNSGSKGILPGGLSGAGLGIAGSKLLASRGPGFGANLLYSSGKAAMSVPTGIARVLGPGGSAVAAKDLYEYLKQQELFNNK